MSARSPRGRLLGRPSSPTARERIDLTKGDVGWVFGQGIFIFSAYYTLHAFLQVHLVLYSRALDARQRMGAACARLAIRDASSMLAEGDNGLGRKMTTSGDNKVPVMEMLSCHVCYDPNCLPLLLN